jgi:hypothetical protein
VTGGYTATGSSSTMSLLWPTLSLAQTPPNPERLDNKPSDRHSYSNRENAADLKQWRGPPSEGIRLYFILFDVTTMPLICRDGTSCTRDVKHELCDTLSARVGNILGSTEGDARESVGDL